MSEARKTLLTFGILLTIISIVWMIEMIRALFRPSVFYLSLFAAGVVLLVLALTAHFANARDLGQWDDTDLVIRHWYQHLMQPDAPATSCCGEGGAYWCDDYYARDGKAYCKITDDRPDGPRKRPHREIGTEFEIPDHKLKWDQSNPTGHGVIFLSVNDYVFCYVAPGGV